MVTVNGKGRVTRLSALGLVTGIALLGSVASASAQTADAAASDRPAGYIVLPKIVVHTTGMAANPPVLPGGAATDTIIQLTNTNQSERINIDCAWVNANSHCGGTASGRICDTNADCPAGLLCQALWSELDFQLTLTPGQPIGFTASSGLSSIPCDPTFAGPGCRGQCSTTMTTSCTSNADCPMGETCLQASGTVRAVPEDPFRGELKCVQVDANDNPVAQNDMKAEATVVSTTVPGGAGTPATTAAAYNAVGFEADEAFTPTTNPNDPLCLGALPAGKTGVACHQQYAPCPGVLILNHFFERATPEFGGVVNTELTLVPCSEDLDHNFASSAQVTAQMLVYNEFEQRFSTSEIVQCYRNTTLSDIDTAPGPSGDSFSIFSAGVAGTLTGQTRIRGVQGAANSSGFGFGLIGVACEQFRAVAGGPILATDAFNLHHSGFNANGDAVYNLAHP